MRAVFRARIVSAFSVTGRGTFVGVEILRGEIRVGDEVEFRLRNGRRAIAVSAVEYIDHIGKGRSEIGLGVPGIEPEDVVVGEEVRG